MTRRTATWLVAAVVANPVAGAGLPAEDAPAKVPAHTSSRKLTPYPGARRLCSQHVLGSADGQRVEISWTAYATADPPETVVAFHAREHGAKVESGATTLAIRSGDAKQVLSIHPVADSYPRCDVPPSPQDRTVLILSHKIP